jgi:hypothetical protein
MACGPGQSPLFTHGLTNIDKASEERLVDISQAEKVEAEDAA